MHLPRSAILAALAASALACSNDGGGAPTAPAADAPPPGEYCESDQPGALRVRFEPAQIVLAPGASRPVTVTVDPDVCAKSRLTLSVADANVAALGGDGAAGSLPVDLRHAQAELVVRAVAAGTTTLHASIARASDQTTASADLAIEVRDGAAPSCDPGAPAAKARVDVAATSLAGAGALGDARLDVPPAAFTRADELALAPFDGEIGCSAPIAGPDLVPLGPAVRFGGDATTGGRMLRRELGFAIPVNPAAMPERARLRHVRVLYTGPSARAPREIPVTSPSFERTPGGAWVLRFRSPWLGTYQAAVAKDAGALASPPRTRHLAHRAILGISMGAGGAATFGLRHHDRFDAIAALGGPVDWSWLLWFVESYALGGSCPASDPSCALPASPAMWPGIHEPFVHTMDYDHLWNQDGGGTGGISRGEYDDMLLDVTLARGNPFMQNQDPALGFFAAGPRATDPFVTGGGGVLGLPPGVDCRTTLRAIPGSPDEQEVAAREAACRAARCDPAHAWSAQTNYFDDEYNPDGSLPVISVCDGGQAAGADPYRDLWAPPGPGQAVPLGVTLAVDRNKNGVRDAGEPLLRSGHEPFDDTGTDGVFDAQEPGYDALTNPDPNQDDYDFVVNPRGTEGDHAHEDGEPFKDDGLDGVPGTASRHVAGDPGEGDGRYTDSVGLTAFRDVDPHWILRGGVPNLPGGPLDDAALSRLAFFLDGGVRDFLDFGAITDHLVGSLDARGVLRSVFYDEYPTLPGVSHSDASAFAGYDMAFGDLPRVVHVRYGDVDASPARILEGDGQHVGAPDQVIDRLDAALHFVSHGWPDADRVLSEPSGNNPASTTKNALGTPCELLGVCRANFTGPKTGRTGPLVIALPPGYSLAENQSKTYPVLFVLHGYGQDPSGVEQMRILIQGAQGDFHRSYATRMAKFITVFVDGRCRLNANGSPECVAGTFFVDSTRPDGAHIESWFEEVLDYIDANYRTMGPTDVIDE